MAMMGPVGFLTGAVAETIALMCAVIGAAITGFIIGGIVTAAQGALIGAQVGMAIIAVVGLIGGIASEMADAADAARAMAGASEPTFTPFNIESAVEVKTPVNDAITTPIDGAQEYAAQYGIKVRSLNNSELLPEGQDISNGLNRGPNGTVSDAASGRTIHNNLNIEGAQKATISGAGIKGPNGFADAMSSNTIYELKPNNMANIRLAVQQLLRYNTPSGGAYNMVIVVY